MTISSTLPATMPTRSMTREEYVAAWDALLAALPDFASETDLAVAAFNFNSTNSTSTTSDTIATGSTTITVQASKSYVVGMTLKIAYTTDATNWMLGEVTAYDSGTGSLTVNVRLKNGSGTYAAWTVSLASTPDEVGDHCVWLHTGNGFGSTNTKHRRYTTAKTNTGTAITYADSAANGATFTFNEPGDYSITMCDRNSTASRDVYFGIAVNSVAGTTNIQGDANLLTYSYIKDNVIQPITIIHRFADGDVLSAKGGTGSSFMPDASGQNDSFIIIRKINNG